MLDLFSVLLVVIVLIPLLYFTSHNFHDSFSLATLLLISIPTIMAMVNGAPYVPTPMDRVKKMLELAKLKPGQRVYDIGCGDGRIVYLANKMYQSKATGFELSPIVYVLARICKLFWKAKYEVKFADYKMEDLSDADVIFCYLLPETLAKVQNDIKKQVKSGTKFVSYAFPIPEWNLIHQEVRNADKQFGPIWVYEKP